MASFAQQLVVISVCLVPTCTYAAAATSSYDKHGLPTFVTFLAQNGRSYMEGSKEYEMRRGLYDHRIQQVQNHNSQPNARWHAVVNHLTDRTEGELSQLRGLRIVRGNSKRARGVVGAHKSGQFLGQIKNVVVPNEKSWGHLKGALADFDQAACGSCWAIAAATMLTANAEIAGYNRSFSAQELVSCTPNPHNCGGSGGCDGATVELAMNWVMEQGLDTQEGTPYLGSDSTCKKTATNLLVEKDVGDAAHFDAMVAVGLHSAKSAASGGHSLGLHTWERLAENEYEPLIRAIAETGPVAVSVGASDWNSYGSGIFNSCEKDVTVNHAVTLIGYGVDNGEKYWNIKNSWGLTWGENGNIRLFREEGNSHCGTDYKPKDGTACDGGPSTVHVCGMCGILYDSVVSHFHKAS